GHDTVRRHAPDKSIKHGLAYASQVYPSCPPWPRPSPARIGPAAELCRYVCRQFGGAGDCNMRLIHFCIALLGALSTCFSPSVGADTHGLIVLDIGRYPNDRPGSDRHRLLVLETESGKTV